MVWSLWSCYTIINMHIYNIMWSSLSVTCDRSVVSFTNKTDRHDITEILLKVGLNTIKQNTILTYICTCCPYLVIFMSLWILMDWWKVLKPQGLTSSFVCVVSTSPGKVDMASMSMTWWLVELLLLLCAFTQVIHRASSQSTCTSK